VRTTHVTETSSRQNGGSSNGHFDLNSETHRYLELFDLAPASYLETDLDGVIRLANLASGDMLSVRQDHLVGTPLIDFVAAGNREAFRCSLVRLQEGEAVTGWTTRVEPSTGPPLDVFVAVNRGWDGDSVRVLRWLIHDVTH
jgi:PAS domain-containing protein